MEDSAAKLCEFVRLTALVAMNQQYAAVRVRGRIFGAWTIRNPLFALDLDPLQQGRLRCQEVGEPLLVCFDGVVMLSASL